MYRRRLLYIVIERTPRPRGSSAIEYLESAFFLGGEGEARQGLLAVKIVQQKYIS